MKYKDLEAIHSVYDCMIQRITIHTTYEEFSMVFSGQGNKYTNPNGLAIFRPQTYCLLAAKYFDNNSC